MAPRKPDLEARRQTAEHPPAIDGAVRSHGSRRIRVAAALVVVALTAGAMDYFASKNGPLSATEPERPAPAAIAKEPPPATNAPPTPLEAPRPPEKLPQAPAERLDRAVPLPSSMASRVSATARFGAMQKLGGKEKSEKAVLSGLRWLKANQKPDGSWSPQFPPAMTGLALLGFLGHGEIPSSAEFGPTVQNAVDYLLRNGEQFQGRLSMEKQFTQAGVYSHAMATYALGEYYTMSRDERVKPLLTQAVTYIMEGQAPDGGWQYAYAKGPESDTSVSGWQIQALKAAHLTRLDIPGVPDALDQAMVNLKRVQGPHGGFGYRKAADSYSLTGVGVFCSYFWKGDKDKLVRDGTKFIIDKSERDYPVDYRHPKADLYAWYYHTQACMMFGGAAWTKWNGWFQDNLCDAQSKDGSWPPTGNPKPHGPEADSTITGQVYRTALCVLMLEVYYRNMPALR
jgi:hypothetical protein